MHTFAYLPFYFQLNKHYYYQEGECYTKHDLLAGRHALSSFTSNEKLPANIIIPSQSHIYVFLFVVGGNSCLVMLSKVSDNFCSNVGNTRQKLLNSIVSQYNKFTIRKGKLMGIHVQTHLQNIMGNVLLISLEDDNRK